MTNGREKFSEVIIIGAGAAGLACALKLKKNGIEAKVLEAAGRVGGRILSALEQGQAIPVELGAEFIHSNSPVLLRYLREAGVSYYEVEDAHLVLKGGKLKDSPSFWDEILEIGSTLGAEVRKRRKDFPLAEFLAGQPGSEALKNFRAYVEGFHAADPEKISARFLAEATSQAGDQGDSRLVSRYAELPISMAAQLPAGAVETNFQVQSIDWSGSEIRIGALDVKSGKYGSYRCRRLVVTLPIGVLKERDPETEVAWIPELPKEKLLALAAFEMGHVQRLVFRFNATFWRELGREPLSFLHAGPASYFPTWWTLAPFRTPYFVAWQGGPKAEEMARWALSEKVSAALATLSRLTKLPVAKIGSAMEAVFTHNWSVDPLSWGAYSYLRWGAASTASNLNIPLQGRIFFAGEATAGGAARGTVHGAIRSGERAATLVRKSFVSHEARSSVA